MTAPCIAAFQWNWSLDGWIVLVGLLSALSCCLPGNYLVLRRLSLMGDAISHAVLPGLAIGFLITHSRAPLPMFLGAVVVGVLTALLTEAVRRHGKVEHGASMGVVFSIFFAAGLVLIRRAADHVDLDPMCVLHGNITQIPSQALEGTPRAVINLAIVLALNVLFVALFYKELKITAFDPQLADSLGIRGAAMHYALMIVTAITTVANFEAVGSILVIAMLIVPSAAARLLTDRLGRMIALSLLIAAVSAVGGHLLAINGPAWLGITLEPSVPGGPPREIDIDTAAMMAVLAGGILFLAVVLSPHDGLIARVSHRLSLSLQILREDIMGLLYRWQEMQAQTGSEAPRAVSIQMADLYPAIGAGWRTRLALRSLRRGGTVEILDPDRGAQARLQLTPEGRRQAAGLVRAHRLWESYLAEHFHLPLDHLHLSAERVEHFLTPALRDELRQELTQPQRDPHGRAMPAED